MSEDNSKTGPPIEAESASAKIREKVRKETIPGLVKAGKDPSNKDVYAPIITQLGKEFGIEYPAARKAYMKVLTETQGTPAPATAPRATSSTEGGVSLSVTPKPKAPSAPASRPAPSSAGREEEKRARIILTPEEETENAELFKDLLGGMFEAIYRGEEQFLQVKIERPTDNDQLKVGKRLAKTFAAYGIEVPDFLMALAALSAVAGTYVSPAVIGVLQHRENKKVAAAKARGEKGDKEAAAK